MAAYVNISITAVKIKALANFAPVPCVVLKARSASINENFSI